MEIRKNINVEQIIYILIFVIGIFFRFYHLGEVNLSAHEASLALQSITIADGNQVDMLTYPVYILWTGVLFFLFHGNVFLARLIPALVGSLGLLVPYFVRDKIGRYTAIILAIAMATDPAFVSMSRIAGGTMTGIVFLLFALVFLIRRKPVAAGVFLGLTILSGPSIWLGILPLMLVMLWTKTSNRTKDPYHVEPQWWQESLDSISWKTTLISSGITILFAGTIFFTVPYGLNASIDAILGFFGGWMHLDLTAIPRTLAALTIYELLPILLAIWTMASNIYKRNEIDTFFGRWFLVSLVLVFLYQDGQVQNIIWVAFPAWVLASRKIVDILVIEYEDRTAVFGQSMAVFILGVFCFLNVLGIVNVGGSYDDNQLRLIGLIGGLVILVLVTFFVGWGWSVNASLKGLTFGLILGLSVFMISQSLRNVANFTYHFTRELWDTSASVVQADLLINTMGDYSEWNTGIRTETDVVLLKEVANPSLLWELRDYENLQEIDYVLVGENPSMVLSSQSQEIELIKDYSGQDFVINEIPAWDQFEVIDWFLWATLRKAETEKQYAVLWVQSDLFPAAEIEEIGIIEE